MLSIWTFLDPYYFALTRLKYIKNEHREKQIFRVRLTRYKGKDMILSDGTLIKKNDLLVKIHLHNIRIINEMDRYQTEIRKALFIYKNVEKALPCLASYVNAHASSPEIKGILGITVLNKGAERLGFEVIPINNPFYERFKLLTAIPIYMLSNSFKKQTLSRKKPAYLCMSKNQLLSGHLKTA
ncbi:YkoP family protein [Bacillus marinisedimentorum]|uniref:YkoP family protein n=1 Tax=Bacillus marinisedimentorum TaxID=1821260 RepID=UPI001FE1F9B4|nr:hypothetical protein [Bacillus marinisedimentorum]